VRYVLGKLPNLLTQSDFKLAGPGLTHNLQIVRTFTTEQYFVTE
jgi:hypothetical protein